MCYLGKVLGEGGSHLGEGGSHLGEGGSHLAPILLQVIKVKMKPTKQQI